MGKKKEALVQLDIDNPKHANLTYEELQALGKDKDGK